MQILVIVDYQNDFVNGSLPCGKDAEDIEEYLYDLMNNRCWDNRVITMDWHNAETYVRSAEGSKYPLHCIKDTYGAALHGKMSAFACSENVKIFKKEKYASRGLLEFINNIKRSWNETIKVTICGVATNICVLQCVLMLYNLTDAEVIVDAKGCASWDKEKHKEALKYMKDVGITVINNDLD